MQFNTSADFLYNQHLHLIYYICFFHIIQPIIQQIRDPYSKLKRVQYSHLHPRIFSETIQILMMEQTDSGKGHHHSIFVTCFNYIIISYGSTRLRNEFYTTPVRTLNIITKREECI